LAQTRALKAQQFAGCLFVIDAQYQSHEASFLKLIPRLPVLIIILFLYRLRLKLLKVPQKDTVGLRWYRWAFINVLPAQLTHL